MDHLVLTNTGQGHDNASQIGGTAPQTDHNFYLNIIFHSYTYCILLFALAVVIIYLLCLFATKDEGGGHQQVNETNDEHMMVTSSTIDNLPPKNRSVDENENVLEEGEEDASCKMENEDSENSEQNNSETEGQTLLDDCCGTCKSEKRYVGKHNGRYKNESKIKNNTGDQVVEEKCKECGIDGSIRFQYANEKKKKTTKSLSIVPICEVSFNAHQFQEKQCGENFRKKKEYYHVKPIDKNISQTFEDHYILDIGDNCH